MLALVSALRLRFPRAWAASLRVQHVVFHGLELALHYGFVPLILYLGLRASGPEPSVLPVFLPFGHNASIKPPPKPRMMPYSPVTGQLYGERPSSA